jgi:N-acetyl-alpha-D-muramate 1-phosphate uridylyltransferase
MMKAMLLAAGRGERLRPLTERVPKALVEVAGKPLIAWHLERLAASGCRQAVVNVSHLGEAIMARLGDGARFNLRIEYSREEIPLETAGGIAQAGHLLGPAPFLLVNADIYCEVDFRRLLGRALGGAIAHLVLVPNPPHNQKGDFALDGASVRNEGTPRYTYAGVAVVSPHLVKDVRPGAKAPLAPYLRAAADANQVSGEVFNGLWQDVGTLERLAELEATLKVKHETR